MINFPDKITPLPKSVIGNMLIVVEELQGSNQTLDILSYKLKNKLDIVDLIDALTCLYAIRRIDLKNHRFIVL